MEMHIGYVEYPGFAQASEIKGYGDKSVPLRNFFLFFF
jgi:hypothetical protein